MLFMPYYTKAFKEMATILAQLHKVMGEVDAMDVQKKPTGTKVHIPSSDSEGSDMGVSSRYIDDQAESDDLFDDMPPAKKAKKPSTKRPPAKRTDRKPAEKKKAEVSCFLKIMSKTK